MKLTRKKLMEMAGLKEATAGVDRNRIAHFVWGLDQLMDKSEDEMDKIIDGMEQEWNASKDNYNNVEEYLKDLENSGDELMGRSDSDGLNEVQNPLGFGDNPYKEWYVANQDKMLAQDVRNALSSLEEDQYLSLMRELGGMTWTPTFDVNLQDTMDRPETVDAWINKAQAGNSQQLKDLAQIKKMAANYRGKK